MAFWNITGGSAVTTFDANGNAVGTDIDQGSIRAMSTGTVFAANTKFTNAGVGNSGLLYGASDSASSPPINQAATIEVRLYKTAIRNGEWNPVTAQFDTEPLTVAQSGGWNLGVGVDNSTTLVASGTDNAANPTQDVPGELVYNYGSGADPTQDEYKAKNLW